MICPQCGSNRRNERDEVCAPCQVRERKQRSREQNVAYWLTAVVFKDDEPWRHLDDAAMLIKALDLPDYQ